MSRGSRPLGICRSLSDSGFEITAQESDLDYYNARNVLCRQKPGAVMMRDRLTSGTDALEPDVIHGYQGGNPVDPEAKACMIDHGLGVLDMVLDSMSRELEVPLMSSEGLVYCNPSPMSSKSNSLTSVKSVVECGDSPEVDDTAVKGICRRRACSDTDNMDDIMLQPPAYGDLSDDDVHHLIDSVAGLHKKLDVLQSKMNNLLQQKANNHSSDEIQMNIRDKFAVKKGIGFAAKPKIEKKLFPRDSIYVQVEQVYYNLQRMHLLQGTADGYIKKLPFFPTYESAPTKTAVAATQTSPNPSTEIAALKEQCDRLEKENASLREKLEAMQKPVLKIAPIPAPRQKRETGAAPVADEHHVKSSEQEAVYTLENYVVGPPTSPPISPPIVKDIRMTEVTYEWTIPDYNQQFQDQRDGRVEKTTSAPFFLTHNGYCARMEAYLNGDGCAKGSYFSVFLRILPSERDGHLPWPAHLKLFFILVNQTDKTDGENKSRKTIVEHSFPRPSSNGNCAESGDCWGVLNLVSHKRIRSQQFIRNDKLLLQCRVHILSPWRRSKKNLSHEI